MIFAASIAESTRSVSTNTAIIPSAFYLVGAGNYVTNNHAPEQYPYADFCSIIPTTLIVATNNKLESMTAIEEEEGGGGLEPCGVTTTTDAPPMHPYFSRSLESTNQSDHLLSITIHRQWSRRRTHHHVSAAFRSIAKWLHATTNKWRRFVIRKRLYLLVVTNYHRRRYLELSSFS